LQQIAAYCSFWGGFPSRLAARDAIDNEFLMGKIGTGWDVFAGFQSHLAMFGDETARRSAAQWVIAISY